MGRAAGGAKGRGAAAAGLFRMAVVAAERERREEDQEKDAESCGDVARTRGGDVTAGGGQPIGDGDVPNGGPKILQFRLLKNGPSSCEAMFQTVVPRRLKNGPSYR